MSSIDKFGEFDGIQAGVLSDGTPFLAGNGLAVLCGVTRQTINDLGEDVPSVEDSDRAGKKDRAGKIAKLLRDHGYKESKLYSKFPVPNQPNDINAYPEAVCMAVLEYYAFEADDNITQKAKDIFRTLVRKSFRDFIYSLVGYNKQRVSFSDYTLSRISHHHNVDDMPLPDGYFCLFDKMIEILQKFDVRIGYTLGGKWYDASTGDKRFLEPDISLGQRFSSLFQDKYTEALAQYQKEFDTRKNNPKVNSSNFWTKNLKELKWKLDKATAEKNLRDRYQIICDDPPDRQKYNFKPSPDSNRPPELSAFCYSNNYTSLFYDWLKEVFFKFVWRDYILERDEEGWKSRYDGFLLLPEAKRNSILSTTEGKLIEGFEYREIWERQLPPSP